MTGGTIYIRQYDWRVSILLDVGCGDLHAVTERLADAGATSDYIMGAVEGILCGVRNQGFTYSSDGQSVVVIGETTTQAQRLNTITHELYHVVCHVCAGRDVQMCSEDAAWLLGDLCAEVWRLIQDNYCLTRE